ncbi:MAG: PorT family protein, partial [Spirochaetota bacterium]|nr:PorT family protein [Spirochaetota bacterium]
KKKDQGLIHLKIGAKGGVSLNSLQGNYGLSHDYLATEGGLATELIIGGNFLVEVDVMYQQRGGIRSTGTRHINYLGIPVLLKAFHPFGDSGTGALAPFISLGMNYQILQDSQFGKFTDNNIKDRNLSIVIAAGFAFQTPNNFMDFTFEWRYEQGITDIGVPSVLRTRSSSYLFGFMLKLF